MNKEEKILLIMNDDKKMMKNMRKTFIQRAQK